MTCLQWLHLVVIPCLQRTQFFFKEIKSHSDSDALQSDINNLHKWNECVLKQTNAKSLPVTRSYSKRAFTFSPNDTSLKYMGNIEDLGVVEDSILSWSSHIEFIIRVKPQLYKSLSRLILSTVLRFGRYLCHWIGSA